MATRVLVVCGGGMSSGFLAQGMRKAAKRAGIDIEVEARSETDVDSYMGRIDVLLVGPHLAYMLAQLRDKADSHGVRVALLPNEIYGRLDGAAALQLVSDITGKEAES